MTYQPDWTQAPEGATHYHMDGCEWWKAYGDRWYVWDGLFWGEDSTPNLDKLAARQPVESADMVNEPPHYKQGEIECIDAIRAALTPEEYRGYLKGNVFKYAWRERHKGGNESLKKAIWYLTKAVES